MLAGLYAARLMNVFERNSDLIAMSAVSDLVNGWPGGIIQASRHGVFVTPAYLVNQLYREHQGTERLAVAVQGPTFDTNREGKNVPYLDIVASRDGGRFNLFVKAVNVHLTKALDVSIRIEGEQLASVGEMFLVSAESLDARNSFRTPNAVAIRKSQIKAGRDVNVTIPKHNVAVLRLPLARER
jgi:alpha-L-arabinofuranosidase